jgi:Tol biopolymer transport system component
MSLFLVSVENGDKKQLTSSTGQPGDWEPAFSPDSQTLAFRRRISFGTDGDIYTQPIQGGEPKRITFNGESMMPAWTPDGQEIVFSQALPRKGLYRISSHGGKAEALLEGGQFGLWPSLSRQGDRLTYSETIYDTDIWRIDLGSNGQPLSLSRLISSSQTDHTPQFSPDGTKVAFLSNRSGILQIWICDSDGRNPLRLTSYGEPHGVGSPSWSPDGRFIAFDCSTSEFSDIFVMSAEGGPPRRLTEGTANSVVPIWSRDGHWIYYGSSSGPEDWQLWKKPVEGGKAIQVTQQGGIEGGESLDGKFIFYSKKFLSKEVWMAPVSGGEESLFLKNVEFKYRALSEAGMYFVTKEDGEYVLKFIDFAKHHTSLIFRLPKKIHIGDGGLTFSPDGHSLLLSLVEQDSTDVMMIENFH